MAHFMAVIERTITHRVTVEIEAEDDDAAMAKADALAFEVDSLEAMMKDQREEWELEDETFEVIEVA